MNSLISCRGQGKAERRMKGSREGRINIAAQQGGSRAHLQPEQQGEEAPPRMCGFLRNKCGFLPVGLLAPSTPHLRSAPPLECPHCPGGTPFPRCSGRRCAPAWTAGLLQTFTHTARSAQYPHNRRLPPAGPPAPHTLMHGHCTRLRQRGLGEAVEHGDDGGRLQANGHGGVEAVGREHVPAAGQTAGGCGTELKRAYIQRSFWSLLRVATPSVCMGRRWSAGRGRLGAKGRTAAGAACCHRAGSAAQGHSSRQSTVQRASAHSWIISGRLTGSAMAMRKS